AWGPPGVWAIDAFRGGLRATLASRDGEECVADAGMDPNAAARWSPPTTAPSPEATTLVAYPVDDVRRARLVAAVIAPKLSSLPFEAGAQLVEGSAPALIVWGRGATADATTHREVLEGVTTGNLSPEALPRARRRVAKARSKALRAAEVRLAAAWSGDDERAPSSRDAPVDANTLETWWRGIVAAGGTWVHEP
ncbi:MAG: hypothetical protein AAGN82_10455, partial [Myxococcota bacterium]